MIQIGIWPDGVTPEIVELLQPAADLGGDEIENGPGWATWTVHSDGKLIGAAQVRRTVDRCCDVVLIGGRDARAWIAELDRLIGEWAALEGCTRMTARGRKGWTPMLTKQGWSATTNGRVTEYERGLS